jgi:hypothetical protein
MTEEATLTGRERVVAQMLVDAALFGGDLLRPESPAQIVELAEAPHRRLWARRATSAKKPYSNKPALLWIVTVAALVLVLVGLRVFPDNGTTKPSGNGPPQVSAYSNDLFDIDFVSTTLGYAIDAPSWAEKSALPAKILVTDDGGKTWRSLGQPPLTLLDTLNYRLLFTSPSVGYLAGLNGLGVTRDGGRSWSLVSSDWVVGLSAVGQNVWAIYNRCTSSSCATDVVRQSTDAGYQWQTVGELPAALEGTASDSLARMSVDSAAFITSGAPESEPDTTTTDPFATNAVYVTNDGGLNWRMATRCPSGFTNPNQIAATPGAAPNSGTFWLTCNGGLQNLSRGAPAVGNKQILLSTDFGRTWTLEASYNDGIGQPSQNFSGTPSGQAPAGYVQALTAVSATKALLLTTEGLYGSSDSGRAWRFLGGPDPQKSPSGSISISGGIGWLSSPHLGLWRSADSWDNWVRVVQG